MEFPCPVPMILSINLPRVLLKIVLQQSDIDDSTIGIDVPRTARAFNPVSTSHCKYFWPDIAIAFSRLERSFDTLQVEIIRMGTPPQRYSIRNWCFHRVNHPLERHDFFLQATNHKTFGKLNEIDWRV